MNAWAAIVAALGLFTSSGPATPAQPLEAPHFERLEKAGRVIIPAIDVRTPIREGTGEAVLALGAGHSPRSDWPGEEGTSIVWAHNVTPVGGKPFGPFHFTDLLERGDRVIFRMRYGTFRFAARRHYIVAEADVPTFFRRHDDGRVYLARCWPDESRAFRYVVLLKPLR